MILAEFQSEPCEYYLPYARTRYGWKRVGAVPPYRSSTYVPGLAHDTMDHWDMQSFEDEAMAHGCEQWMRAGNFVIKFPKVFDVGNPFWWVHRDHYLVLKTNVETMVKTKCPPLKRRSPEPHLDVIIEARLRQAFSRHTRMPYNYMDWFRHGYRQAEKRYNTMGRERACEVFQELVFFFHKTLVEGVMPKRRLVVMINEDGSWSHSERDE